MKMRSERVGKLDYCPFCGDILKICYENGGRICDYCGQSFSRLKGNTYWTNDDIIDISPSNPEAVVLCTTFPHKFTMNTTYGSIEFASMEAFLQSLAWNGSKTGVIKEIAKLHGMDACDVQSILPDWRKAQTLYWDSKPIPRESAEYEALLETAYDSLFKSSALFQLALAKTKGKVLLNTTGTTNPKRALITSSEFIKMLERERAKLSK